MQWFVERPFHCSEEDWTESGIGVSGDSGAGIVDDDTNVLYGQLWGRNKYESNDPGSRITFFTPMVDIFDDIQEKFSHTERPRLPQLGESFSCPDPMITCPNCGKDAVAETTILNPIMEPDTPGIDITKDGGDSDGSMTPMRELIDSVDMTPLENELLTPVDVRSPGIQRQHDLLFGYTGMSCPLPRDEFPEPRYNNMSTPQLLVDTSSLCGTETYLEEDFEMNEILDIRSKRVGNCAAKRTSLEMENKMSPSWNKRPRMT
jgi:hypothetical protein